jgi:ABC-type branched-subunit amino acid transport system substrate-binding protein
MLFIKFLQPVFIALTLLISSAVSEERRAKVGVITGLSGPHVTIGTAIRNGIELARHQRPDILQRIDFQYEDDQGDPKLDIAAYRKLMDTKGVDILFGLGPVMVNVLWSYIERDQIPFINFNFEASCAVGRPLVVRAMNHTEQYMLALSSYLKKHDIEDEYPVVVGEHTFLQAMSRSLATALGSASPVREVATVLPNETDFRPVILKMRKYKERPVGLFLFPDSLISFLKQARGVGFSASYFGTDLCESAANLAESPALLEGCVYPDNAVTDTFRGQYREKYGNEAQLAFAGSAYDMTVLVGELFSSGHPRGSKIIEELNKVSNRRGVLGDFSFKHTEREGNFFEYPIHVKRIKAGRGEVIE